MKRHAITPIVVFCIMIMMFLNVRMEVKAADKPLIIAIDPGHGGENLGAEYNNMVEKDATLKVAQAMKKELEKYENVQVYLTRTDDSDIDISQRVKDASVYKPAIILSLHFNMSELHTESGNEMWISSREDLYQKGYRFAAIESGLLEEYGIPKRGIFVRLNSMQEDYYGIIRYASQKNIPAVIVEHCYFDHENDEGNYETDAALERLGKLDATAVAMTYRLHSDVIGVDYSDYRDISVKLPETYVLDDQTPPSLVHITPDDYDEENRILELYVEAYDDESSIANVRYTITTNQTISQEFEWDSDGDQTIKIPITNDNINGKLRVYATNAFGLESYSNIIDIAKVLGIPDIKTTTYSIENDKNNQNDDTIQTLAVDFIDASDNDDGVDMRLKRILLITTPLSAIIVIGIYLLNKKGY